MSVTWRDRGYWREWYHRPGNPERQAELRARPEKKLYMREWHKRNPGKDKGYKLKEKFDLSITQYNEMFLAQGGVCAICKSPPGRKALAVDHDHGTGRNRALLCSKCNVALERMDNIDDWAGKAARYKAQHAEGEAKETV